jgi:DNA-binding winged helix-turn-helix (wHTH) protein
VRIKFGPFILDSDTRQLTRDSEEIHLSPKAFDLLRALVERRPNVVEKDELHERIWPGTFVVDANLNVVIGEIRRALDDEPRDPRFIRTVHKVGYAFCGVATEVDRAGAPASAVGSKHWLAWNDRTLALSAGDNIIGRDPQCSVWLDVSGVSRQHARIQIQGHEASIEVVDSTNGTFLQESPVTTRTRVNDGDVIRLGPVTLTFRAWSVDRPKATERIKRP